MVLLHEQPISVEEIETETSAWDVAKFASLCNALVSSMLSLREPFPQGVCLNTDGMDAEATVEFENPHPPVPVPFLQTGNNTLQYRRRNVAGADRFRIVAELTAGLQGELVRAFARAPDGRRPSGFALFVNVDLSRCQWLEAKDAILDGYDAPDSVRIEIVDASMLAALLSNESKVWRAFCPETGGQARPYPVRWNILWDCDVSVGELKRYIQDRRCPEHQWAIGRVLGKAPWQVVRQLLSVADIADAIDEVDIPEEKREAIRAALKVWRNER